MKKYILQLLAAAMIANFSLANEKKSGLDTVSAKYGNTVSGNQVKKTSKFVFIQGNGSEGGLLCAGHSLTKHAPLPSIWWNHDWGMAASAEDKDYVHQLWAKMKKEYGDMPLCIVKAGYFERNFDKADEIIPMYKPARDFKAKYIVISFVDNVSNKMAAEHDFIKEYEKFINYLNPDGKAKVIITTGWYPLKSLNNDLKEFAKRKGIKIVDLAPIFNDESNRAIGLWKHKGVASHPGDKGMAELAKAYFRALKDLK